MKKKKNNLYFIIIIGFILMFFLLLLSYKQEDYPVPINFIFNESSMEVTEECINASISVINVECNGKLSIEIANTGIVNLGKIYPIKAEVYNKNYYTAITVMTSRRDLLPNQKTTISTDRIRGNVSYIKIISNKCTNAAAEVYVDLMC